MTSKVGIWLGAALAWLLIHGILVQPLIQKELLPAWIGGWITLAIAAGCAFIAARTVRRRREVPSER